MRKTQFLSAADTSNRKRKERQQRAESSPAATVGARKPINQSRDQSLNNKQICCKKKRHYLACWAMMACKCCTMAMRGLSNSQPAKRIATTLVVHSRFSHVLHVAILRSTTRIRWWFVIFSDMCTMPHCCRIGKSPKNEGKVKRLWVLWAFLYFFIQPFSKKKSRCHRTCNISNFYNIISLDAAVLSPSKC